MAGRGGAAGAVLPGGRGDAVRSFLARLSGWFRRARHEREMREELEAHFRMHIEDNLRAGMGDAEAPKCRNGSRICRSEGGQRGQLSALHRIGGGDVGPDRATPGAEARRGTDHHRPHGDAAYFQTMEIPLKKGAGISLNQTMLPRDRCGSSSMKPSCGSSCRVKKR